MYIIVLKGKLYIDSSVAREYECDSFSKKCVYDSPLSVNKKRDIDEHEKPAADRLQTLLSQSSTLCCRT